MIPVALAVAMTVHAAGSANADARHGARVESPAATSRNVSEMKIRMNFEGKVITGTLVNTETARDFASLLPLTLTLKDYSGTEKISDLPRRLCTKGAPEGSVPSVGDIAYYAPWGTWPFSTRRSATRAGSSRSGSWIPASSCSAGAIR